jgi:ubiquinone/menaquinone biosynthesis C-methylase UbiE
MDQQTIKYYNELAKIYDDETKDFWERFPTTIIDAFVGLTNGKILDVGSGSGADGLILQRRGFEVICLDASKSMVALSSQKGLVSIEGDFNELPFSDGSFDGIWAYTSLLHIKKAEIGVAIGEIRRVLKAGGSFCFGMIEGDKEEYRESSEIKMPRFFSFYKKEELETILTQFGFQIIYFEQFQPKSKNYLNFICQKRQMAVG